MHRTGIITQYINTWKHWKLTYANFNFMHKLHIYIHDGTLGMIICILCTSIQRNINTYTSQLTYTNNYNRMRTYTYVINSYQKLETR